MTTTMPSYQTVNGTHYHALTPPEVVRVLEIVRQRGRRIRLTLGDPQTGRLWDECCGVEGYVSRSTGPIKVPLLIHNSRSLGGPAILDHCIIGIRETGTKGNVLFDRRGSAA